MKTETGSLAGLFFLSFHLNVKYWQIKTEKIKKIKQKGVLCYKNTIFALIFKRR